MHAMQAKDIAVRLNEPACSHNDKGKSGCARPTPRRTASGWAFDGAQIALLSIADALDCKGCGSCSRACPKQCHSRQLMPVTA